MKLKSLAMLMLMLTAAALNFSCEEKETIHPHIIIPTEQQNLKVTATQGTVAVEIKSNISYTVLIADDAKEWLSVQLTKSMTSTTIKFVFTENNTGVERIGSIVVVGADVEPQTIKITQSTSTEVNIPEEQKKHAAMAFEGTHGVDIASNVKHTVTVHENAEQWLSIVTTKVLVQSKVNIKYTTNNSGAERVGQVIIAGEGLEPLTITITQAPRTFKSMGLYTLYEGQPWNKSTQLGFIDNEGILTQDYFGAKNNGEKLGSIANDIIVYGSKTYVVMNASEEIQVLNTATGKKLKSINTQTYYTNEIASPRFALGTNGKVYVTTWHKGVLVVDTTELKIVKNIEISDSYHEQIVANDDKMYVANSGLKSDVSYYRNGKSVSVISIATETELETITVPANPNRMDFDKNGKLYVSTWGVYPTIGAQLHQVDVNTKTVLKTYNTPTSKFVIADNSIFTYDYDYINPLNACKIDIATAVEENYFNIINDLGVIVHNLSIDKNTQTIYYLGQHGDIFGLNTNGTTVVSYPAISDYMHATKVVSAVVETTQR